MDVLYYDRLLDDIWAWIHHLMFNLTSLIADSLTFFNLVTRIIQIIGLDRNLLSTTCSFINIDSPDQHIVSDMGG